MSKGIFSIKAVAAAALVLGSVGAAQASFVNGGFESPLGGGAESSSTWAANNFVVTSAANVPGWQTTAPTGNIEIWRQPGPHGINMAAYEGERYAELNADAYGALFQDVTGIAAGQIVGWELAHRGRWHVDTMDLTITDLGLDGLFGTVDDTTLFTRQFSDGPDAWAFYQGSGITTLGNTMRFAFGAVTSGSNDPTIGNLLDAVDFGVGVGQVPEPASLALLGVAMAGVAAASRRRKQA